MTQGHEQGASSSASEHEKQEKVITVTRALIIYRLGTLVALAFMVYISVKGKNTAAGIDLALVTTAALCLTPEIGEALSSREIFDSLSLRGWRPTIRGLMRAMGTIASCGVALVVLNVAGILSRFWGVAGVGLIAVALYGLTPLWASKSFKDLAQMILEVKKARSGWERFETRKGPALLGTFLFIVGTLIQLVTTTQ
jgi:hypothetical protein